jgi:hypothetical protein
MSVDLWQLMADVTMKKWIFHHQKWWLFMVILWMGLFETLHQLKTDGGKLPTILFGFQPTFLWRRISQPSTVSWDNPDEFDDLTVFRWNHG